MLRTYVIFAFRRVLRRPAEVVIEAAGTGIGLACCVLILLFVRAETSFDRHLEGVHRIVLDLASTTGVHASTATPPPLADALRAEIPGIVGAARLLTPDNPVPLVSHGSDRFYEPRFYFADPSVTDVFSVRTAAGVAALERPGTVLLTESVARRYFTVGNPVGERLRFNDLFELEVTGIVEDPPERSSVRYDFLASFGSVRAWLGDDFVDSWNGLSVATYVRVREDFRPSEFEAESRQIAARYAREGFPLSGVHLQPMTRVHLYSRWDHGLTSTGDIQQVIVLSAIALLVFVVGCINSSNLKASRFRRRRREFAVRTALGAERRTLAAQFLIESTVAAALSVAAAVVVLAATSGPIEIWLGVDVIPLLRGDPAVWRGIATLAIATGLAGGAYPALLLSRSGSAVRPLESGMAAGRVMVVVQFAISFVLVATTLGVRMQVAFLSGHDLGITSDPVVVVPVREESLRGRSDLVVDRFSRVPGVVGVSTASLLPGGPVGRARFLAEGADQETTMSMLWVDEAFLPTLGIDLVAGRNFSPSIPGDSAEAFILNHEAVRRFGWGDPASAVGRRFALPGQKRGFVIGVVEDFHFASLRLRIEPLVLHLWPWANYALVRLDGSEVTRAIQHLKTVSAGLDPGHPFEFTFLDERFGAHYASERRLSRVSTAFALVAVALACAGLFGLAALAAESRRREIGIRRILGASITGITLLLSRELVTLVAAGIVLGGPVAALALTAWLDGFAYRTDPGADPYLAAGLLALVLAVGTIAVRTVRVAAADPVRVLRDP